MSSRTSSTTSTDLTDLELHKILPNTLYLTFNAPQVNEYHRGLFLTYPPVLSVPTPLFSGTLFHASYTSPNGELNPGARQLGSPRWMLEHRVVKDLSLSKSLVLLHRVASFPDEDMKKTADAITAALAGVPLGREARTKELGEVNGNAALGGYDCVIWTGDALSALVKERLIDFGGRSVAEIMVEARALAGPEDARTMVGVDFGGFRVIN